MTGQAAKLIQRLPALVLAGGRQQARLHALAGLQPALGMLVQPVSQQV